MKRALLAALVLVCAASTTSAQGLNSEDIARRTIESRAVEAVIWGMPAVNTDLMLQEMLAKTSGRPHQVLYWSRFSSLTLYNVHHFFEPNALKRYSLGTKNKTLKTNPDGSWTPPAVVKIP